MAHKPLHVARVAFMNKIVAVGRGKVHLLNHPDLFCCKNWTFEILGKESYPKAWHNFSPLERPTFLRGEGIFPKSIVPHMLKALSGPLPMERVTREEWNGEVLSPETGGSQECVWSSTQLSHRQLRWWAGHFSLRKVTLISTPHVAGEASDRERWKGACLLF